MKRTVPLIITICLLFSGYTPSYGMFARGRQAFARLSAPVAFSARNYFLGTTKTVKNPFADVAKIVGVQATNRAHLFKKIAMGAVATAAGCAVTAPTVDCYFYGGLIMFNPQTGRYAILLGDLHAESKEVSAGLQRGQVLKLIKGLLNQGESVHVLAEDKAAFMKDKGYKFDENKVLKCSPLSFFSDMCKNEGIPHTNIECRDNKELEKLQTLTSELEIIKRKADPALFKQLEFYYSLYRNRYDYSLYRDSYSKYSEHHKYKQSKFAEFIDAHALECMQTSNASVSITLAGAAHIASLSKELYKQGYTRVNSIMPEGLSAKYQSDFTDFNKNKPINRVYVWEPLPPHLPHIDTAILEAVKKLKPIGFWEKMKNNIFEI